MALWPEVDRSPRAEKLAKRDRRKLAIKARATSKLSANERIRLVRLSRVELGRDSGKTRMTRPALQCSCKPKRDGSAPDNLCPMCQRGLLASAKMLPCGAIIQRESKRVAPKERDYVAVKNHVESIKTRKDDLHDLAPHIASDRLRKVKKMMPNIPLNLSCEKMPQPGRGERVTSTKGPMFTGPQV